VNHPHRAIEALIEAVDESQDGRSLGLEDLRATERSVEVGVRVIYALRKKGV
jgi:hypothetical protein